MTKEQKLKNALNHLHEIINLIQENEYENYLLCSLISVKVEIQRQLTNLQLPATVVK